MIKAVLPSAAPCLVCAITEPRFVKISAEPGISPLPYSQALRTGAVCPDQNGHRYHRHRLAGVLGNHYRSAGRQLPCWRYHKRWRAGRGKMPIVQLAQAAGGVCAAVHAQFGRAPYVYVYDLTTLLKVFSFFARDWRELPLD